MELRVLIHAPRGRDASVVHNVLASQRIESLVCESEQDLMAALEEGAASVILTLRIIAATGRPVIKQMRRVTRVVVITAGAGGAGTRTAPNDVQRLLVEQWRRAIIKEKVAAKQRRLVSAASAVCPASLDEITVVTRIGRLRLLRKLGGTK